jgi:hypothetical protein
VIPIEVMGEAKRARDRALSPRGFRAGNVTHVSAMSTSRVTAMAIRSGVL